MQAADFFQKAGQLCEKYGSHVKGLLQDKLVEQEMLKQTVAVHGKFLPLSVWEQKGFDTERIKQNAEKQRSDIFDWVYHVPILEISHEKVTEKVRQRLLQAERKVGKRKASQQMEDEDVVDLEVDTKDWEGLHLLRCWCWWVQIEAQKGMCTQGKEQDEEGAPGKEG